jgi:hypothetical protein
MINYTTLLKLAQPQPGTEDGSWGTTVNDALTSPLDIAVGGSATIDVTSGNVVLTNGDGSASNQARYAVLRITGTPGTTRNVEAPGGSTSRNWYVVRNESNGSVVIKENATTGVTIPAGKTAVVMWSGSDYVIATVAGASSSTDNAVARFDGTSGQLIQNSAVTIADTTGDITGGKYNGLTITTSTGTLTVANGKTFTASNTLTLTGTDGTTAAFGAGLTIAAGKTFGVNNSLTLAGTDSTTMTFPGTSATIARTDAAQTFTGIQTFSSAPVMSALTVSKPVFTSAGGALTSSGTLLTDQGGTGQTTYTAGDMVYYATGTAMTKLGIGTTNYVLTSSGSAPQWSAPASVVIGTATNIQGGAAGSVPYQSGASTTTFLGIGSAAQVLQVNSGGTAPEWVSSTGTGSVVRATSPTLVTPALGTPSTINLANATNLPLGTITGLGTGVATALAINVGSAGAFVPTTGSGASGTWTISINGNANTATTATTASTATNIASGGTNQVVYQSSSGSTSFTPSPSSGNLYLKWTGSAFTWDAPSGSGDVSGPASSTADGLVAFDGTSGKIIKAAGTVTVAQGGTGLTALGSALQVLRVNASATALEYATVVTNPAGANTEIQFNNSGAFGASANLTWNGSILSTTGFTASSDSIFSSTGALTISKGTTAQRPTAASGMLRFNTDSSEFEGYNGTTWASVGGASISNDTSTATDLYPIFVSATSGTASTVKTGNANLLYKPSTGELKAQEMVAINSLFVGAATVATSYTIPNNYNAMSPGPTAVGSGITVTVPSGSTWTIV